MSQSVDKPLVHLVTTLVMYITTHLFIFSLLLNLVDQLKEVFKLKTDYTTQPRTLYLSINDLKK